MTLAIDESQRNAARIAGFAYLFALVPANFAEFYVSGQLIVPNDAAATARNITAHETLFRLGIASNLVVFATDVVLLTALYVVLERVSRNLALLAAFFRLVETAVIIVVALHDLDVVRVLSGADYLRAFDAAQLHALARLSIGAHGASYIVALLFFGIGSSVFGYLWLESNYVPKPLAALGVFASVVVAAGAFTLIISPGLSTVVSPAFFVPIFVFELTMGFWLAFKGLVSR